MKCFDLADFHTISARSLLLCLSHLQLQLLLHDDRTSTTGIVPYEHYRTAILRRASTQVCRAVKEWAFPAPIRFRHFHAIFGV